MSCIGAASFRPKLKKNKLTERDEAHAVYPYETDTHLVLGPEVIASKDGSTVVWRGVAYYSTEHAGYPDPLEIK